MKRTKKMMFVTLMATTAIVMTLMSRAFAAPAAGVTNSTCPTKNILNQLTGTNGFNAADLQKLLNNGTPTTNVQQSNFLQDLLNKFGIKMPTGSTCPKITGAPVSTPAPTAPVTTPKPTGTPAPSATPAPTSGSTGTSQGSMTADEQKMIALVNKDRADNGLPALTFDSTLRAGALEHSKDMSANNYFSHTSPTQGDFTARIRAAGVKYTSAGENIAQYGSVEAAETGFMNSPGHRANILNANFTRIGIGIVYNQSKGAYYITQWFAK